MPTPSRAPSIRQLRLVTAVVVGTVTSIMVMALVWSSLVFERALASIMRDARSEAVAAELAVTVLMFQRISNFVVVTGDGEAAAERAALRQDMDDLLNQARAFAGTDTERDLLDVVASDLTGYVDDRERLEQARLSLDEIVEQARPALAAVLGRLEALRQMNHAEVETAHDGALWVDRLARYVGVGAGALLLIGWILVVVGVRRYLLRPMLDLHESMARFSRGDSGTRGPAGGVRELAELGQMFDGMAASLAQRRQDQLAFLAGVAHDLKNPLSALKLGIHALERDASDARRAVTRDRLERQVDLLARMVDDLLDATRIEAGQLEIRKECLDLRDLVTDMVRLFAPTAADRAIEVEVPDAAVLVQGDPLRVEQVISNLLSNAIKFSPRGSAVRVAVTRADGDAVLAVSDRGMGIPPDEVQSIFLPFRRRAPEKAPGAGLGLSVVRRIVEAHGGRVEVASEPAVGSTFRVVLPMVAERDASGQAASTS